MCSYNHNNLSSSLFSFSPFSLLSHPDIFLSVGVADIHCFHPLLAFLLSETTSPPFDIPLSDLPVVCLHLAWLLPETSAQPLIVTATTTHDNAFTANTAFTPKLGRIGI